MYTRRLGWVVFGGGVLWTTVANAISATLVIAPFLIGSAVLGLTHGAAWLMRRYSDKSGGENRSHSRRSRRLRIAPKSAAATWPTLSAGGRYTLAPPASGERRRHEAPQKVLVASALAFAVVALSGI